MLGELSVSLHLHIKPGSNLKDGKTINIYIKQDLHDFKGCFLGKIRKILSAEILTQHAQC